MIDFIGRNLDIVAYILFGITVILGGLGMITMPKKNNKDNKLNES